MKFYLDKSSPQTWKSAIAFTRAVGEEARAAGGATSSSSSLTSTQRSHSC
ncbi:4a-hydroxytetrahydrobiopterin dehydratase domain protein [Corynebacterium sp. CMW7794]|nr:4a-hydroxytetrahydrobiopterin dehydratase domain protein [Corynebacterium sp. CMW7794]